ncbi:MAG TPA: ThuA domain-containing protein [Pirellulales bacterium]|nr:ThuA domain-containing protein [Pirellulales bacterium]
MSTSTLPAADEPPKAVAQTPAAWADGGLPVHEGLAAWFDASVQAEARRENSVPSPAAGAPLDTWYDGSGQARHAAQKAAAARPRWLALGERPIVGFDGEDDFLAVAGLRDTIENATVFIVAAPRSNLGAFRALLAFNARGENDYVTGLTVDLSGQPSAAFETLNLEGPGFGGAVDLCNDVFAFGEFHVLEAIIAARPGGVSLLVDGKPQATRDRAPGKLRMDELYLGARYYGNGESPRVQGFFDGALAEVLVYDRLLSDVERLAVREYLAAKHAGLPRLSIECVAGGKPLVPVEQPPAVQMFVPGFTVRELPLELTNVNNIRARGDGKLVALAYDGNVYLLSDSDGDGLEDRAEPFWDNQGRIQSPIGMALTPPGYAKGNGLFIAGKGKCSLVVDTDGDDRADDEIVVADGWQPLAMAHGVDALGIAIDADHNVYFGLGTADYTNAYQLDGQGRPHYDLAGERGAILKLAPDFSRRVVIATGIRFPVALAFNADGELKSADVMVFYSANPAWSPEKAQELDQYQARDGGLVFLHYAVNGQRAPDQLADRIGLAWQGGQSRFRHGALDLEFASDAKHPISRNFKKAHFEDESYWELVGDPARVHVLATGVEEDQPRPLLWTYERGEGRVVCSILGHYSWTFDDPLFRILVFRSIAWTARENVDRFNELATIGARMSEP